MVKVFFVDDHEMVRPGFIDLLCSDRELDVVGKAGSVAEAMAKIPPAHPVAALMGKLQAVIQNSDGFSPLNDRERTLLGLLGEGLTNKQIAVRMFLTEDAVKNYVSRLLAKLGMARPAQSSASTTRLSHPIAR